MKNISLLLVLFLLSNCSVSKKTDDTKSNTNTEMNTTKSEANININDIWALESIDQKVIDPKALNKRPMLEIHVKEMKIMGNDGCNNIGGNIVLLDASQIKWGPLMGTKMACPNMDLSNLFNQKMELVAGYKLENLKLYLYDSNQKELMVFRKID